MKPFKKTAYGVTNARNSLLLGDAHDVLPRLLKQYSGAVNCVYIDPPYNNGEIYKHYADNMPQEAWLSGLQAVLTHLKDLLASDGSIWISIDDSNMHHLKVLADTVFGSRNFIATIVWQHRTTRENRNIFSNNHEYILLYAANKSLFKQKRNKIAVNSATVLSRYKNPDNDPRGPWQSVSAHVQDGHAVRSQFYDIVAPNGTLHKLPIGRCWAYAEKRMREEISNNNIWFGRNGKGVPRIKSFLKTDSHLVTPDTLWLAKDVGTTDSAKKHLLKLLGENVVFDTPKPEELIMRILSIATDPGDLVLDCFLGSGTTASVAHKMGRRYIGIEKELHALNLSISRLRQVVDGECGGISRAIEWRGGGGFTVTKVE